MRTFKVLLCLFLMNSSCVHLNSVETQPLSVSIEDKIGNLIVLNTAEVQVEHVIFQNSNMRNDVLRQLIRNDIIPVYVSIRNVSTQPQKISPHQFILTDQEQEYPPLNFEEIPQQLTQFYPPALFANIYNVTVFILAILAIVYIIFILTDHHHSHNHYPSHTLAPIYVPETRSNTEKGYMNDLNKTTIIDYKDLILRDRTLNPEERIEGVIFFKKDKNQDGKNLKLNFEYSSGH